MKDFLLYIHAELCRMTSIHKSAASLSKEDEELHHSMSGALEILYNFAARTKDGKLLHITQDLEYSLNHMWVSFKAEVALKDAGENIVAYRQEQ